jgi:biotin carboxylase
MAPDTYRATDFLTAAQRSGVRIAVGTPVQLAFADDRPGDYLTLPFADTAEAVARARAFAAEHPVDAVVGVDDDAVLPAAAIAEAIGARHNPPAAAGRTRDKAALREALRDAGVAGPDFRVFDELAAVQAAAPQLRYPCVLKPRSLSASRGVIRADDEAELVAAARRVFALLEEDERPSGVRAGRGVVVEDFLPGEELAVEGLLRDGELEVLALFDKPDPLDGPYFEETLYITPSRKSLDEQLEVKRCVAEAAAALGLVDGPVHAEVRLHEGAAVLLEVAARTIGGLCGRTLRFGMGLSLEDVVLRHAAGLPVGSTAQAEGAAGVMMLPIPRAGVLMGVSGREEARAVPGIEDLQITAPLGQPLAPPPDGRHYLGFLFARAARAEDVESALRTAWGHLEVRIEGHQAG